MLALLGLHDHAHHRVDTLSYAQCRQLEVAVALAAEPRVLLLDEPAAGMSAANTTHLLNLLRRLPADITLIFVEHDLDLVFELATDITVLHLGQVLTTGTPTDVQTNTDVQQAYLGTTRRGDLFTTNRSTRGEHAAPDH
jgi:branched-chain amino acid transport system ATP-binding protein